MQNQNSKPPGNESGLETLENESVFSVAITHLMTLHRLVPTGYVVFALCENLNDWNRARQTLEREVIGPVKTVIVSEETVSSEDPNFLPLLRALGSDRAMVLLYVDFKPDDAAFELFCLHLNFQREKLLAMGHGLVFCLSDAALRAVSLRATDTFVVKRGIEDFRGAVEHNEST
jgi:hypothetical protein